MKAGELPLTHFSHLENDFKAEVTAAEMLELGIQPDGIIILMLGAMKRSVRRDVQSIEEESSVYDRSDYVVIKTPKEGFYDMLPEGLFHHPSAHKTSATVKEISKAIKRRKEEEQQARNFFIPFEAAVNHLRTQAAFYEARLDKRSQYTELVNIFAPHWDIFKGLDGRQANLFLHLLPILHDIRDNHPVAETIMEMMLGLPVKVRLRSQQPYRPAEPILSVMGDSVLGVNLTTGNEVFDEGVNEILIRIGPVTGDVFQLLMPGGEGGQLLQRLADYLLPAHLDVVTEFELQQQDRRTKFANEEGSLNSVLGTDTYL
jgi:type VI secretion system protein ImpH